MTKKETENPVVSTSTINGRTGEVIPSESQKATEGKVERVMVETGNYSPEERAKTEFYKAEKRAQASAADLYDCKKTIYTYGSWFLGFLLACLSIFWAYKINNISEPIGGLKEAVKNNSAQIEKNENAIHEIENALWPKEKIKNSTSTR